MLSAFADAGQRAKKKLAKTYGATAAKARTQPSSSVSRSSKASSQAISDSSASSQATMSQTLAKDIYDFDFVDDVPPPMSKIVAGPTGRLKPAPPTKTGASKTPKALPTTKTLPSAEARGIKRKTPQAEPAVLRHQSNPAAQSKRPRQPPSPSHDIVGLTPSKAIKTKPDASPLTASPSGHQKQEVLATASAKVGGVRSPSASPRRLPPPSAATGSVMRSSRILQTAEQATQNMPFRPLDNKSPDVGSSQTKQRPAAYAVPQTPRAPSSTSKHQSTQRKRRRLIDTLTEQMERESEEEEEEEAKANRKEDVPSEDDEVNSMSDAAFSRYRNVRSTPVSEGPGTFMDRDSLVTASPGRTAAMPSTPTTTTRRVTARRPGVKFTYSVERTMLAEEPVVLGGPQGSDLSVLESLLPAPESTANAFDMDEEMGGTSQGSVQSIHELRQAGANSRHADELVDIMDRVGHPSAGKPSSARRSALLEVVHRLQAKSFVRHFRDQGAEMQLLRGAGNETDIISGFSIACAMVALLASGAASHRFSHDFRQQKMKELLSRLVNSDADIVVVARDRKNNVSNHMRGQLADAKSTLQKTPVWKPAAAPTQLSPRTLALKALHMYAQQLQHMSGGLDEDGGVLSPALTKQLFDIVSSTLPSAQDAGADGSSPPPPDQVLLLSGISTDAESVDLYLALSLLEMHSVSAMQSDISAEWTRHYISIVADALQMSLQQQHQRRGGHRLNELELLVLKLAMNTANNNPDAARYYVEKGLLGRLAMLNSAALAAVVRSAKAGIELAADELNELLLMLGVMINFSENDVSASETLMQESGGLALFEQLGKSFLEGCALAAEADSEEKTQLNVAFAYLSVLLGYLCLHEPVYEAFRKLSPSGNLKPVLESIRQFILLHDQLGRAENGEDAEMSHFAARLRALADELDVRA